MKRGICQIMKWTWLVLALLLLLFTVLVFDGTPNSDADIVLGYGLLILTFPIGLLVSVVEGFAGRAAFHVMGLNSTTTFLSLGATWLIYAVIGYLQWFVFIPWAICKLREKNDKSRPPSEVR